MARPKSKIDWSKVDDMLEKQCEGTEIAGALGMHPNTFYNRVQYEFDVGFSEYKQQKRESGKSLLRKKQFEVALEGNTTMLVWLGKQYLQQTDKVQTEDKTETLFDKWISQYETEPETDTSPESTESKD